MYLRKEECVREEIRYSDTQVRDVSEKKGVYPKERKIGMYQREVSDVFYRGFLNFFK